MSPALLALLALLVAIALSIVTRINVGLVAIGLAWLVGVYGAKLSADTVLKGFPASLFLTLAGVTLLFAVAETNGTLERLTTRFAALARGNPRLLPLLFFALAALIASAGPGAIAAVALVIPVAMVLGRRAGVPAFLTALMVTLGGNAGNLSPLSVVGVIANTKMAEAGLAGHELKVWLANLIAHSLVGLVAWLVLARRIPAGAVTPPEPVTAPPLSPPQRLTALVLTLWIAGVLLLKLNLGLSAFAAVVILVALHAADESRAVARVPWNAVLMVCGVSVLVSVLESTGGMDLFTALLARLAGPSTINGVIAFITGAISTWSSTSGVVLPAFLPTVPKLVQQVGGGDPLAVALSINVGASLVDVSPLSTLGALCVAAVPNDESLALFRRLLAWGVSMIVVGAVLCQVFVGAFARL